jgi:hypothetical protein
VRNVLKHIEVLEKEIGGICVIPEKERHIVIPYPADQEEVFECLKQEAIKGLKEKYGPNINEDDLFIVGIKKFYRK